MVIKNFSGAIFLDTAPLIYFIEGNSQHQQILSKLFDLNDKGEFSFVTTSITLLEVLVKPMKDGQPEIAKQYKDILTKAEGIEILDLTPPIAEIAAGLRAKYENPRCYSIGCFHSIQMRLFSHQRQQVKISY